MLRNEYRRLDHAASTAAEHAGEQHLRQKCLRSDTAVTWSRSTRRSRRIQNLTSAELQALNQADITPDLASTKHAR